MINKTSVLAIRTLIFMGQQTDNAVRSPRQMAEALGESPTYLSKVTQLLARAGILRAEKGVHGGVYLGRPPADVTLLQIVEACQGSIVAPNCRPDCDRRMTCSYHVAAEELRVAIVGVLSGWTLARLMVRSSASAKAKAPLPGLACLMNSRSILPAMR